MVEYRVPHLTTLSFETFKGRDLTRGREDSPSSTQQLSSESCSQRLWLGTSGDNSDWLGVLRRHDVAM
jgi:hypothetical protein